MNGHARCRLRYEGFVNYNYLFVSCDTFARLRSVVAKHSSLYAVGGEI